MPIGAFYICGASSSTAHSNGSPRDVLKEVRPRALDAELKQYGDGALASKIGDLRLSRNRASLHRSGDE